MSDSGGDERRAGYGRRASDTEVAVTLAWLQGEFNVLAARLEGALKNLADRMDDRFRDVEQAHRRLDAIEERARTNTRLALTSFVFPILVAIVTGILLTSIR